MKAETDGHLDLGGAGLAASLIDLDRRVPHVGQPGRGRRRHAVLPRRAGRAQRLRRLEARALPSGSLYLRYERAD